MFTTQQFGLLTLSHPLLPYGCSY